METRVRLLVSQVFLCGFSWDDLENYLSTKKSILIQEIQKYFKKAKNADERVNKIISRIDANEQNRMEDVFVR